MRVKNKISSAKKLLYCSMFVSLPLLATDFPSLTAPGNASASDNNDQVTFSNDVLSATFSLADGDLTMSQITDKLSGKTPPLSVGELFTITLGDGTLLVDTDMVAGSASLEQVFANPNSIKVSERNNGWKMTIPFDYSSSDKQLRLEWSAMLRDGANYIVQDVSLTAQQGDWDIDRVSLIDFNSASATIVGENKSTAGGAPMVAGQFFFAQQNPLAQDVVADGKATAYAVRESLFTQGQTYAQSSVLGLYPDTQLRRGFQYYLERERASEHHPFLHYNTWWDLAHHEVKESFLLDRIEEFGRELVTERGVQFDGFLVDDGYDNLNTNTASHIWQMDPSKWPTGLTPIINAADNYDANIAIWMSPGGGYSGVAERIRIAQKANPDIQIKTVNNGQKVFKVSDPAYYNFFKEAIFEKQDAGVKAFKFDNIFGADDVYAVATLSEDMRAKDPEVFINTTVGTWGSPYFMWFFDSIWKGGGDALDRPRKDNMTFRDYTAYDITTRNPLFPLNSLMVHGIGQGRHFQGRSYSKDANGDMLDLNNPQVIEDWKGEVRSYFAMGFNLQELYVTPMEGYMNEAMWDALAEAAKWGRANHEVLLDSHFIGARPGNIVPDGNGGSMVEGQNVYGVASWHKDKGILMLRNPKDTSTTITLTPKSAFDLPDHADRDYLLVDPFNDNAAMGDFNGPRTFTLAPFEVLVYEATPNGGNSGDNEDGAIHHWDFNSQDQDPAFIGYDIIGGALAEVSGTTKAVGKFDGGLQFDGIDDYMSISGSGSISEWTVSTWVKRQGDVFAGTLISSQEAALMLEQIYEKRNVGLTVYGVKNYVFNHETPLNDWQHLTFVGTAEQTRLYVDGEFVDELNVGINLPLQAIGRKASSGDYAKMTIDDLKVFYSALSDAEVMSVYTGVDATGTDGKGTDGTGTDGTGTDGTGTDGTGTDGTGTDGTGFDNETAETSSSSGGAISFSLLMGLMLIRFRRYCSLPEN